MNLQLNIPLKNKAKVSRILPLRINDISEKENKLLEQELDGFLRSIDFIFDAIEGVSRPLISSDDISFRTGSLLYRNQLNKAANIIRR